MNTPQTPTPKNTVQEAYLNAVVDNCVRMIDSARDTHYKLSVTSGEPSVSGSEIEDTWHTINKLLEDVYRAGLEHLLVWYDEENTRLKVKERLTVSRIEARKGNSDE